MEEGALSQEWNAGSRLWKPERARKQILPAVGRRGGAVFVRRLELSPGKVVPTSGLPHCKSTYVPLEATRGSDLPPQPQNANTPLHPRAWAPGRHTDAD